MLQRVAWPPDYYDIWERRKKMLKALRGSKEILHAADEAYALNPVDFISDWVDTYDPRNAAKGEQTRLPFVLFSTTA